MSWDTTAAADANGTAATTTSSATPAASSGASKPIPISDNAPKQSWAQLLRKPEPAPIIPQLAHAATLEPTPVPIEEPATAAATEQETLPIPSVADEVSANEALEEPASVDEPSIELTPSKDQLTEENLEHLPDTSHPAPTGTVASTIDSHSATPSVVPHAQQAPIGRPPMGGFATSAHRATATPRSASFQRRFMEQQEAVVMPGNHAIDRTAVQFGSMGLNGDAEPDVDEDREDAETRLPPQLSPPSQPRASLPPAPRQAAVPGDLQRPDPTQASNPPPGLLATQPQQPTQSPSAQLASQNVGQQGSQAGQPYNQFGRIGQGLPADATAPRPYDPFGQHQTQQSAFDNYPSHSQAAGQAQQQSQLGGISSGPTDFSSYYTSDHSRNPYPNYYGGGYGQQNTSNQQEQSTSQQRTGSAFGGSAAELGYNAPNVRANFNAPDTNDADEEDRASESTMSLPGNDTVTSDVEEVLQQHASISVPSQDDFLFMLYSAAHEPQSTIQATAPHVTVNVNNIQNVTINVNGDELAEEDLPPYTEQPETNQSTNVIHTSGSIADEIPANEQILQTTSSQPRYGATAGDNTQHSGHTTPNPTLGSGAAGATTGAPSALLQQPSSQPQQSQQQPFNQQTPQGHAGAQHPGYNSFNNYYNSPYYASYMNQYHYGQGAGGYGGGPFGRNNYAAGGPAAHHGYGLPSHSAYDQQSSSPANVGGFGGSSLHDRAPGLGGLSDYARSGSAQGGSQTGGAFGGMGGDSFGRSPSGFPNQNTPYGQQSSNQQQQSAGGSAENDPLKPFGDPKVAGGPSPGLPGRPGSATNQTSGLPPPQNQHGGFGPFSSQFGQGAYGSLGGLGGQHGQHGAGGYSGGFGSGYTNYGGGGYGRGGGWGGNYANH